MGWLVNDDEVIHKFNHFLAKLFIFLDCESDTFCWLSDEPIKGWVLSHQKTIDQAAGHRSDAEYSPEEVQWSFGVIEDHPRDWIHDLAWPPSIDAEGPFKRRGSSAPFFKLIMALSVCIYVLPLGNGVAIYVNVASDDFLPINLQRSYKRWYKLPWSRLRSSLWSRCWLFRPHLWKSRSYRFGCNAREVDLDPPHSRSRNARVWS